MQVFLFNNVYLKKNTTFAFLRLRVFSFLTSRCNENAASDVLPDKKCLKTGGQQGDFSEPVTDDLNDMYISNRLFKVSSIISFQSPTGQS